MERKIKDVAIYVRKSREEETEEVINRQQAILVELCNKNQWEFEIFKEVGSSQELNRPQLQQMLDKAERYSYDAIVVNDLDRLSRSIVHSGQIKECLVKAGCKVVTPNKVYDFTKQEDDLYSDIQSVMAKNEYQTIKKRLMRGSIQSAKDGNWMGKKTPIGYSYNRKTKRLEITEDAFVINRLFTDYAKGMSTKDIAHQYTLEGVGTTVGLKWSPSGVSRLLNNPVYKGDSLYRKTKNEYGKKAIRTNKEEQVLVENTHDAIVNKDLWDQVQAIKGDRTSRPASLRLGKHTFSGLIRCALCNRVHSFQTSKGGKKRIDSCQTREYDESNNYVVCKNQGVNMDNFDVLFYGHLEKYIQDLEKYKDSIQDLNSNTKREINDQIGNTERQLQVIDKEVKRVQDGYINEIFSEDDAKERIKILKVREKTMINQLEQLKENQFISSSEYLDSVMKKMVEFVKGKDVLPPKVANDILREFLEVIYYKKINNGIELDIVWKDLVN